MNPVFKIINLILTQINKLIDNINQRVAETIRNAFYLFVAVLAVVGIIIGYSNGKHAAQRSGQPLAESTNDLFEIPIRKEQDRKQYKLLLETDFEEDFKGGNLQKIEFPDNVKAKPEFDNTLIEKKNTIKYKKSMQSEKTELAETNPDININSDKTGKKDDPKKTEMKFPGNTYDSKSAPDNEKINPIHRKPDIIDK